MKEKMLQVKEYVIAHKKQVIIGGAAIIAGVIFAKPLIKKLKAVEVSEDALEEFTGGTVEEIISEEA